MQELRCLRIKVFYKLLEELIIAELVLLVDACAVSTIGIQTRNSYSLSTRKEVVIPISFQLRYKLLEALHIVQLALQSDSLQQIKHLRQLLY